MKSLSLSALHTRTRMSRRFDFVTKNTFPFLLHFFSACVFIFLFFLRGPCVYVCVSLCSFLFCFSFSFLFFLSLMCSSSSLLLRPRVARPKHMRTHSHALNTNEPSIPASVRTHRVAASICVHLYTITQRCCTCCVGQQIVFVFFRPTLLFLFFFLSGFPFLEFFKAPVVLLTTPPMTGQRCSIFQTNTKNHTHTFSSNLKATIAVKRKQNLLLLCLHFFVC